MAESATVKNNSRVSEIFSKYLEYAKETHGKSQTEVANEMGVGIDTKSANFISLIKSGRSKLPIDKVEPFLKACGVKDGSDLVLAMIDEYYGDVFSLLKKQKRFSYSAAESSVMAAVIDAKREADEEYREENRKLATNRNEEQKAHFASTTWSFDGDKLEKFKAYIKANLIKR